MRFWLLLFLLSPVWIFAQDTAFVNVQDTAFVNVQDTAYVNVRALNRKNAVLLRWAVNTPVAWTQTNASGFDIERYTLVRDGKTLPQPELKKLNSAPVKAKPLDDWENIVKNDDYAAVIAQAIYGEDFSLSAGNESSISKIVNMSLELEQRFVVSLYAADNSFEAALAAGWGWRDMEVKQNERYLYRIIPLVPENNYLKIEYGIVFVATDEDDALPKPVGLTGIFGNKNVMLAWDFASLRDVYNSYYIEKSTDGKNFTRLDGIPVTNMNNKEEQESQRMYFMDSLANNTESFYYRIVGITAFGETGPPSETISGLGKELLPITPSINNSEINSAGNLELGWEFDEKYNPLIKGFVLYRSDNASEYKAFIENIKPEQRSLLIAGNKLAPSNYFTVTAIPHEGEPASSFPILVQPVDSTPPAIPTGLTGTVDTAGIVTLKWKKNTDSDLLGYKVFRAQLKDEEPVPMFDIALKDTVFRDTIEIKNLNRKIYYTIASLDLRYNQSNFAPLLELDKPDIVPPSSPVISEYKIRDDGIEISWINSSDPEVTTHRIRRKNKGTGFQSQTVLANITDRAITSYVDTSVVANIHYVYNVTALKNNLLESPPSNEITLFTNKSKQENLVIDRFDAIVDKQNKMLKLVWRDRLSDVLNYELYKGTGEEPVSLWKTLQNGEHEILDENLFVNTSYRYIIRAILKSGKNTKSKELIIKY